MYTNQLKTLHTPMIVASITAERRSAGLGQLDYGDNVFARPVDDWWQRYIYDSTQRGLDIVGARYGQGDYYSPDDPRYRTQTARTLPSTTPTAAPTAAPSMGGINISTNMAMLVVGGVLLFMLGKRR